VAQLRQPGSGRQAAEAATYYHHARHARTLASRGSRFSTGRIGLQ